MHVEIVNGWMDVSPLPIISFIDKVGTIQHKALQFTRVNQKPQTSLCCSMLRYDDTENLFICKIISYYTGSSCSVVQKTSPV